MTLNFAIFIFLPLLFTRPDFFSSTLKTVVLFHQTIQFRWNVHDISESQTPSKTNPIYRFKSSLIDQSRTAECSISGDGVGDVFQLIPSGSCYLYLVSNLDREQKSSYDFRIDTIEHGQILESDSFSINVLDINDNAPEFTDDKIFRGTVSEKIDDFDNEPIITLEAIDLDDSHNSDFGKLSYFLVKSSEKLQLTSSIFQDVDLVFEENAPFKMQEETGDLFPKKSASYKQLANIDREIKQNISLPIKVCDNLNRLPSNCDYGMIVLDILDANDNAPVFSQPFYSIQVPESIEKDALLFNISITDNDTDESHQKTVFKLAQGSASPDHKFVYVKTSPQNTALVYSKGLFDFETKNFYKMQVIAENTVSGKPQLQDTTLLQINVSDVNEPPIFPKSVVKVSVPENAYIKDKIPLAGQAAYDPEGDDFKYKLRSVEKQVVSIDPDTGALTLEKSLDREEKDQYTGEVCAIPVDDQPEVCTTLIINVSDVNDNPPVLISSSSIPICGGKNWKEDVQGPAGLIRLGDPDSSDNFSSPTIKEGFSFPSELTLIVLIGLKKN